ncbi:hypothetical protein C5167_038506 [Papaver somniferum]|uniref:Uncharacterized protein n=1 Tax=Papaver somniferum TaxID=3469 RepID=A0A4Y7I9P4_PAPSO|nr:heat shock 70 kDa protein, mitochondrial-like [Papaver somniferum]RZC45554.1 hypothetical protein C5167_038506 [Papaver somniferum]
MAITSSLLGILRTGRVLRSSSFPTNPRLICKLNTSWTSSPSVKKMSSLAERLFSSKPIGNYITANVQGTNKDHNVTIPEESGFSFKIIETHNGDALIKSDDTGHLYSISHIGPYIFTNLKNYAETSFGRTLSRAVIRVPSYFNYAQRRATKDAAIKAGLEVDRIVTDDPPAYALFRNDENHIAVLDLSAGNFDLCIKEQATSRGSDDNLLEFIVRELKKTHGFDVREDPLILKRLEEAIEKASIPKAGIKLNIPSIQGKAERLMTIKWA